MTLYGNNYINQGTLHVLIGKKSVLVLLQFFECYWLTRKFNIKRLLFITKITCKDKKSDTYYCFHGKLGIQLKTLMDILYKTDARPFRQTVYITDELRHYAAVIKAVLPVLHNICLWPILWTGLPPRYIFFPFPNTNREPGDSSQAN